MAFIDPSALAQSQHSSNDVKQAIWTLVAIGFAAILVVVLILWGIR
jgi:hypothetical protein